MDHSVKREISSPAITRRQYEDYASLSLSAEESGATFGQRNSCRWMHFLSDIPLEGNTFEGIK